jgi:hypothetical protein
VGCRTENSWKAADHRSATAAGKNGKAASYKKFVSAALASAQKSSIMK